MKFCCAVSAAAITAMLCAAGASAGDEVLGASKDNTLYEDAAGSLSNGSGWHCFVGVTAQPALRRALLAFDLSSIPAGATVVGCELTLNMSQTISGETDVSLHRALAQWGEGASDALGEEGRGAPAEPGDATWLHTEYDAVFWSAPGGDFVQAASATTPVAFQGPYTWSSPGMVADVQAWLDGQEPNHGWVVLGDESGGVSAKRFDTRENPDGNSRPGLRVLFVPPCIADWNSDGNVNTQDVLAYLGEWASDSLSADVNYSGNVDIQDFLIFLNAWNAGCP